MERWIVERGLLGATVSRVKLEKILLATHCVDRSDEYTGLLSAQSVYPCDS
jgi:hypothetical protein